MPGKATPSGKLIITFIIVGLFIGMIIGMVFGWQYAIVGIGVAIGPWIGGYLGNKKAHEVDAYRDELIKKRKTEKGDPGSSS